MKRLTPVLMVSDLPVSLAFWHERFGFELKGTVPVGPQGPVGSALDPWLSKVEGLRGARAAAPDFLYGADEIGARTLVGAMLMLASFASSD